VADWLPLPGFGAFGIPQGNTDPTSASTCPMCTPTGTRSRSGERPRVRRDRRRVLLVEHRLYERSGGRHPHAVQLAPGEHRPGYAPALLHRQRRPRPRNHRFAFTGLQDNGTRMRDSGTSSKWNQVVGGDGVAAAISVWDDGSHQVFFHSLPGAPVLPARRTLLHRRLIRSGHQHRLQHGAAASESGLDDLSTEWTT